MSEKWSKMNKKEEEFFNEELQPVQPKLTVGPSLDQCFDTKYMNIVLV